MALVTTQAIVLKSMRWGEADRILTFFSLRFGKVRGIARGARRMKSRFGGMLEPFSSITLTFFDKRNDSLASVSQIDTRESFIALRESLDLIWAASRMVALVDGVTADRDPSPKIFHTLLEGLRLLVRTDDPGLLTLIFQVHVLGQSGFQPQIERCASCGRDVGERSAWFSSSAGGRLCGSCDRGSWEYCLPMSQGSTAFLRQAWHTPFERATRLKAGGQVRKEIEAIVETYASAVVGKRLPAKVPLAAEPAPVPYGPTP
ncbi:MAG: DNA repair protein RecO [Nitrospira sp.]|nr:DNA repair protein RecO [Nitrospira sp.]